MGTQVALHIAISFLFFSSLQSTLCTFTPPDGWELVDPRVLPARTKKAFICKNRSSFSPSINLTLEEEVQGTLENYLKCVKTHYEKDPNTRWRDLGNFQTLAGIARLTSIDTKNKNGEARLFQLILLKDQVAYILTAAASKKEFPELQKLFERAFCSLNLTDDLLESTDEIQLPTPKE